MVKWWQMEQVSKERWWRWEGIWRTLMGFSLIPTLAGDRQVALGLELFFH